MNHFRLMKLILIIFIFITSLLTTIKVYQDVNCIILSVVCWLVMSCENSQYPSPASPYACIKCEVSVQAESVSCTVQVEMICKVCTYMFICACIYKINFARRMATLRRILAAIHIRGMPPKSTLRLLTRN